MANGTRIRGITLEIGGNTTDLQKSLKAVDDKLKDTQAELRDVNKLLKLDPKNTELLRQKQELLNTALEESGKKVETLENALKAMGERTKDNAKDFDAIERELVECKAAQSKWNSELDSMKPKVKDISDTLKGVSDKTGKWAESTKGLSLAAGAAGTAMLGMAYNAGLTADELLTDSKVTGFTVEELQKLKYASDLVDVSYDSMKGSITKVTKSMASGSKAFEKLGVAITNQDGSMRSAVDVWYDSIAALGQIQNETERDQLSMELFGKSAMEMAGIVDDGGAALKELGQQAEDAGLIMGGEAVEGAGKFNDAIDTLKARTGASFAKAGAALAETLIPALEKLVDIVSKVLEWFANLDGTTQTVILTILALVAAISPVLGLISTLTGLAAGLNVAMLPMIGTIAAIVAAVAAVIAIGVALYKNWDTIKAKATELWQNIKQTFHNIWEAITTPIKNAVDTVKGLVEKIKGFFNFKIELPKIKLPHFYISPRGWKLGDLLKGSIPHLGIDWYAKAMDNGVVFDRPTVVPTANGLKGFGDAGRELVIGESSLMRMIRQASSGAGDINVSVTVNGNVEDYNALAETIGQKLQQQMARQGRAFA